MSELNKYIIAIGTKTLLKLHVQPGASKNKLVGLYGNPVRFKIKIKAPPQDGEANGEVITFFAKILKISKSKIEIKKGHISRQKDLLIELDIADVIKVLQ